jgi:hypothetical protein
MDYEGIKTLLWQADRHFPRLSQLWLDAGYRGEEKGAEWVEKTLGWSVEARRARPRNELSDYEKLSASGQAFVYAAMSRLMLRRLTRL